MYCEQRLLDKEMETVIRFREGCLERKKIKFIIWACLFVGVFLILCQIGYSDGDDAFFYEFTHRMSFTEYLSWRYDTWVGRMAAEALVYITFHCGIWFWRVMNACMLVLLPIGIVHLAKITAKIPDYSAGSAVAAIAGYFLMDVMTVGYAAIWVNGSVFYTWTFTCGIYALIPIADYIYNEKRQNLSFWQLAPVLLLSVIAAMSIEQMGAVLLTLEAIGVGYLVLKKRKAPVFFLVQLLCIGIAFTILFLAPGNELRVSSETLTWMPQFSSLSVREHLFMVVLWLVSSFANENCLFLCLIWIAGMALLYEKKAHPAWMAAGGIFTAAGLLGFAGVSFFSDAGLSISDITVCLQKVPEAVDLTAQNWFALIWWSVALVFTFVYLWKAAGFSPDILLVYLAGIASLAIMYFSPTIFASGARVYYLTDLLFLFLILTLSMRLKSKKLADLLYVVMCALGACNFVLQIPVIYHNF